MRYKQCRLQRRTKEGIREMVSWLPAEFAKEGQTLRLKKKNGEWVDGWTVVSYGDELISERHLDLIESHYSHKMAERTDI